MGGLYSLVNQGGGPLSEKAVHDLVWWKLRLTLSQPRSFSLMPISQDPLIIYTDAEGSGGMGAVLVSSTPAWLAGHVDKSLRPLLHHRKTHIFVYEALAAFLSAVIFNLAGQRVLFFVGNTSALGALRKGSSSSWDVQCVVDLFWDLAASRHMEIFFRYVPSKLPQGAKLQ